MNAQTLTPTDATTEILTGAEIVVRALVDQGVEVLFGYPGGAVLPIYDALFNEPRLQHILVRHEQGATHAAEGYARSTGKPGVVLVTSGPGATNAITGIVDALMDSIPLVVITGQVATHLIGTDAFQECDTIGITRSITKHNYLVKSPADLPRVLHEAFHIATSGRPGPVVIDIPKDVQFGKAAYQGPGEVVHAHNYRPRTQGDPARIAEAAQMIAGARRPVLYTGGGVINAGPRASALLREFAALTGAPVTSTLMGLGAFPASDDQWLGMLGMHGSFEANNVMHDCDVMVAIGSRFDDRVTGKLDAFSPGSRKIHIDIDASSISKNVRADIGIIGDAGSVLEDLIAVWKARSLSCDAGALAEWWRQIEAWRARKSFSYTPSADSIKPQYAIERLYALTRDKDVGRAIPGVRGAEPLDDLRRARHHGLRPARRRGRPAGASAEPGHRHRRRRQRADDHAGDVDGHTVWPAYQDLHPEQRVDGHGAPVAAAAARRALFTLLLGQPARLREVGGGLRLPGPSGPDPGRAGRRHPPDDRLSRSGHLRLLRDQGRKLLPHDPLGQGAQRDDPG